MHGAIFLFDDIIPGSVSFDSWQRHNRMVVKVNSDMIGIHQANLYEGFELLEADLRTLRYQLLEHADYPFYVDGVADPGRAREAVVRALTSLHYDDGQAANEVIHCPALVGTSAETLALAACINDTKARLHATLKALDPVQVDSPDGSGSVSLLRVALRRLGHARLQRRQTTRRIEMIELAPSAVTFTWAHARRKENLTAAAIREMLLHKIEEARVGQREVLLADLQRLEGCDDETPLVRLYAPYQHPRANLAWRLSDGTTVRKQRRAVVPLLYPAASGDALPDIRPLPATPHTVKRRQRRPDAGVEERPLLRSIGVHRVITQQARCA